MPDGQMMQLPGPTEVGRLLEQVGSELRSANLSVMQYGAGL